MRKLTKNKTAKGLVSLITIIILLSSILAASIFYERTIKDNVIKENSFDKNPSLFSIEDFKEDQ